jgi:SAM-dependent methyltransferase
MSLYQYGNDFFAYQQIGSFRSAQAIVPLVLEHLETCSVLDVGCGAGAWIAAYAAAGVADVAGVDGGYVSTDQLMFDASRFQSVNVAQPFHLGRTFDLVQCLEVAEHLDPAASETLVDSLVAHAPAVLVSAAPPGQGGEHHVNERPYQYWRGLFARRGYELFDFVRPRISGRTEVEPWYRYNVLLFVRSDATPLLHPAIAATRVSPGTRVLDVSPVGYRIRKRLLALAPVPMVTRLASFKHKLVLRRDHRAAAS